LLWLSTHVKFIYKIILKMLSRVVEELEAGPEIVKVLYFNGDREPLRSVKGVIEKEDDNFIVVRSGRLILRLGKRYVVKIESLDGVVV